MPRSSSTWIAPQDPDQLTWIMDYLHRHLPDFIVPISPYTPTPYPDAGALIAALDARMGDTRFLDRYRKMQNAWRQEKSRRRPDKRSVTFQLSSKTLEQLDKLAWKRSATKVSVLGQVISDAWHEHDRAAKQMRKDRATYQARLQDQRRKYKASERTYRDTIDALLEALAKSLDQQSWLEAMVVRDDNAPLNNADQVAYQAQIKAHLTALEAPFRDIKLMRLKGGSLKHRLQTRADARCSHPQDQYTADHECPSSGQEMSEPSGT